MRKTKLPIISLIPYALIFLFVFYTAFNVSIRRVNASDSDLHLNYDGKTVLYTYKPISLFANGQEIIELPVPPIIFEEGSVLVPVREVFEALGAVVDWKQQTQEAYIAYNGTLIVLKIDSCDVVVDNTVITGKIPTKVINEKTMIPLGLVSEQLGFIAKWDSVSYSISIDSPAQDELIEDGPFIDEQNNIPEEIINADTEDTAHYEEPDNLDGGIIDEASEGGLAVKDSIISESTPNEEAAVPVDGIYTLTDLSQSITPQSLSTTEITGVILPEDAYTQLYTICASSGISKIKYFTLDNKKLVVDIYNAAHGLPKEGYASINSTLVASIRSSQFESTPEKITRIVFDMKNSAEYKILLSEDRKNIYVDFGTVRKNSLTAIDHIADGSSDAIYIYCTEPISASMFALTQPDRVVVDLALTNMDYTPDVEVIGEYLYQIRGSQFDETTTRLVFDLSKPADFQLTVTDNTAILLLSAPTYRGLVYEHTENRLAVSKLALGDFNIDINGITEQDEYDNKKYVINLGGDFSAVLGYGDIQAQNAVLSTVSVQNNGDNITELVFNQRRNMAYFISEDDENIYIKPVDPKEKYGKILVIDPGHGGKDPGTKGGGMIEKDINLDVVKRVIKLLEADGTIKVYSTRMGDTYPTLQERVEYANYYGDAFLSVHSNYADNKNAHGIETYYFPHDNDGELKYSSLSYANAIHQNMLKYMGCNDRKVRNNNFYVVKNTRIPAVLCEIGYVSNADEAALMATDSYRDKIALGIYNGIVQMFSEYTPKR